MRQPGVSTCNEHRRRSIELCELYGGTEVQSVTWITGREWLEHRGSVGKPISGKMKVVGDDGQDLPPGEIGEIYMLADGGTGSTRFAPPRIFRPTIQLMTSRPRP